VRPWADFTLRVAAAVAAALVLSPVAGLFLPATPFHRVMTRAFQVSLVVALLVRRPPLRTWPAAIRAMGLRGPWLLGDRVDRRQLLLGAGVGVAAMVGVLLLSWLLGGRAPQEEPHRLPFAYHAGKALLTALVVSTFEEILVRGYLRNALGGLASAILFAGIHFVQPSGRTAPAGAGYDPLLAVKRLPELLESWTEPQNALLGFPCLLLLALALNRLRDRTGALYLGIGLHAGVVLVVQLYRRFLAGEATAPWIYGGAFLRDGLLPLLALLLLLLAAYRAPLPRA
jgi:hypothetical protein